MSLIETYIDPIFFASEAENTTPVITMHQSVTGKRRGKFLPIDKNLRCVIMNLLDNAIKFHIC
jgi:signal transduction histidine kinase